MTTINNPDVRFAPIIDAAAQLLSQQAGVAVQLTDVACISEEERRNRLLRGAIANPPSNLPVS